MDFLFNRLEYQYSYYERFEEALFELLEKENFEQIDLTGNDLSTISWHQSVICKNDKARFKIKLMSRQFSIEFYEDYTKYFSTQLLYMIRSDNNIYILYLYE